MSELQRRTLWHSVDVPINVGFRGSCVTPNDAQIPAREYGERAGVLGWLLILARQRSNWSPFRISGELWRLLTNIGKQREILRLLKVRPLDEIAEKSPRFAFKYLIPNYLVRGFTVYERACCFLHHYKRMHSVLPESALRQILQGYVTLYEISEGENCFALTTGLSELIGDREGELSLDLRVDGKKVFNLSFTIVPGWVVKSEVSEILLITRLQGTLGARSQIRLARKAFYEFFPGKLLLAALQGIAAAFGIGELDAVCATNQTYYVKKYASNFQNAYDDFFAEVGMVKTAVGFYSSPVPIQGRPLASFKGRNRLRARKRRTIRQQIQSACAAFFLGAADQAADYSSGAVNSTPFRGAVEPVPSPNSCPTPDLKIP